MGWVDLHVHTTFSDGTMTPRQMVERARRLGVELLAIADHEVLEGSRAAGPLCREAGIRLLPAVELSCLRGQEYYHLLGYGVDLDNPELMALARRNRALMDGISERLVERMSTDYPQLSVGDYADYRYDASRGGWKGLGYLLDRGVTGALKEGLGFYGLYGASYQEAGFPEMAEVAGVIHRAGGRAVLAHPGEVIEAHGDAFEEILTQLLGEGIDGLECYYPTHTPQIQDICLRLCRERELLITTGSDCHGAFGHTDVGQMRMRIEQLELGALLND